LRGERRLTRELVVRRVVCEGLIGLGAVAVVDGDLSVPRASNGAAETHTHGVPQDEVVQILDATYFDDARNRYCREACENAAARRRSSMRRPGYALADSSDGADDPSGLRQPRQQRAIALLRLGRSASERGPASVGWTNGASAPRTRVWTPPRIANTRRPSMNTAFAAQEAVGGQRSGRQAMDKDRRDEETEEVVAARPEPRRSRSSGCSTRAAAVAKAGEFNLL
jgi:hypothetical protein